MTQSSIPNRRESIASADKEFSAAFGLFAYAAAMLNMALLKPLIRYLGYSYGGWNGCQYLIGMAHTTVQKLYKTH